MWLAGRMEPGISANKASSSFYVLVFWRGAGRWLPDFSDVLPRRQTEGESSSTSSFNKRVHLLATFLCVLLALLAGRGGEGEGKESMVVDAVGWWWGDLADDGSASDAATSKRRRRVAAAIFGQRDGLAMLVRELLLPPAEDLLRSLCGIIRSCCPKWLCPRRRRGRPHLQA